MALIYANPTDFRVFPTNLESEDGKQVHWRATANLDIGVKGNGPFTACPTWLGVDRPTWGLWGLDDFTFHLGEDGKAKSLEVKALKVIMERNQIIEKPMTGFCK